jgi:hypothetical protein
MEILGADFISDDERIWPHGYFLLGNHERFSVAVVASKFIFIYVPDVLHFSIGKELNHTE